MNPLMKQAFFFVLILSLVGNAVFGGFIAWRELLLAKTRSALHIEQARSATLASEKKKLEGEREKLTKDLQESEQQLTTKVAELRKTQREIEQKQKEVEAKRREISDLEAKIKRQEDQLRENTEELARLRKRPPLFVFQNESSNPDVERDKAEIREVVEASFDVMRDLLGDPYLLAQVTITFVDAFSNPNAAGEIIIENSERGLKLTIKIKRFSKNRFQDVNTILHEIIHAFHGLSAIEPVALEEGRTVAETDFVMAELSRRGAIPRFESLYVTISEERYNELNQDPSFTIPAGTNAFYRSSNVGTFYQVVGKAWQKLAAGDSSFFKRFNEAFYAKVRAGNEPSLALTHQTIAAVRSEVAGQPIREFIAAHKAFNPR